MIGLALISSAVIAWVVATVSYSITYGRRSHRHREDHK